MIMREGGGWFDNAGRVTSINLRAAISKLLSLTSLLKRTTPVVLY